MNELISLQLFDFDLEVIPILEVLVGKTVEQALLEVMEEEELAALREQQVRAFKLFILFIMHPNTFSESLRRTGTLS